MDLRVRLIYQRDIEGHVEKMDMDPRQERASEYYPHFAGANTYVNHQPSIPVPCKVSDTRHDCMVHRRILQHSSSKPGTKSRHDNPWQQQEQCHILQYRSLLHPINHLHAALRIDIRIQFNTHVYCKSFFLIVTRCCCHIVASLRRCCSPSQPSFRSVPFRSVPPLLLSLRHGLLSLYNRSELASRQRLSFFLFLLVLGKINPSPIMDKELQNQTLAQQQEGTQVSYPTRY
jgi:hypothetical protein